MNAPRLRRAGPADAARLSLIRGATFLEAYGSDHPGDALIAHIEAQHSAAWYRRMLADPACAAWVLEAGWGAQAGYAVLTLPDLACETGARDVELKRLYLLGGWQSGGWGGLLLGLVETEAAARGAERLLLCVHSGNGGAPRFYRRHGFADVGVRQTFPMGGIGYEGRIFGKRLG